MSELRWVLETEFKTTLQEILTLIEESEKTLASASGKFILGGNDTKLNGLKAIVTINSDEVTDADISVECPSKHTYKTAIADGCTYRMMQLVNCSSTLQATRLAVEDALETGYHSEAVRTLATLGRLFDLLKQARDHVVLPQKRTVDDLVHSKNRELFQPQMPSDICLSLYVSGQKLILAVYFLHTPSAAATSSQAGPPGGQQHPHHEIACRLNVQATVPWLGGVLGKLSLAMLRASQLTEKLNRICYTLHA